MWNEEPAPPSLTTFRLPETSREIEGLLIHEGGTCGHTPHSIRSARFCSTEILHLGSVKVEVHSDSSMNST